jgi:hypothetical protein
LSSKRTSKLIFQEPKSERQLFSKADAQITEKSTKRQAGNGQKRPLKILDK